MKCRDCPLGLSCYAGRLGQINWCPECHYLVVAKPDADVRSLTGILSGQIRLRCEERTAEFLARMKREGKVGWVGTVHQDPVVLDKIMGVTQCSKCEAKQRIARGMRLAMNPEEFDAVELD